jgi:anti-sigma-K factor RskA
VTAVTGAKQDHTLFDELAAGYAVHALEPHDELVFLGHLRDCDRCEQALADYGEVTAEVAGVTPAADPPPELRSRILAAALSERPRQSGETGSEEPGGAGLEEPGGGRDEPGGREQLPPVVPLHRHRPRRWLNAAAVAAAAVVVAGGVWAGLGRSGGSAPAPLAACVQAHQCTEVTLTAAHGHKTVGRLIIKDGTVWMLPSDMAADNVSRQIYVLWQITGSHTPLSVGSFDVRAGAHGPVRVGKLATPFRKTWVFAVSLEHGRSIPAQPSQPVALGEVSA